MSAFIQAGFTGLAGVGIAQEAQENPSSAAMDAALLGASFIPGPIGWAAAGLGLAKAFFGDGVTEATIGSAGAVTGLVDQYANNPWMSGSSSLASSGAILGLTGQAPISGSVESGAVPSPTGSPEINQSSAPDSGGGLSLGGLTTALGFSGLALSKLGGKGGGIGSMGKGAALGTVASSLSGGGGSMDSSTSRRIFGTGGNPIFSGKSEQDKDREQLNMLSAKARNGSLGSRLMPSRSGSPSGPSSPIRENSAPFIPSSPMHPDAFQGRMHIAKKNSRVD